MAAVAAANRAGLRTVVVTNQSGVARGYFSARDVEALHLWMQDRLLQAGARIDAFYYCPFHPDAVTEEFRHPDHPDRKPNPGMLLRAIADLGLDPAGSIIIGDQPRDLEAGRRAGVRGLLYTGGSVADLLSSWLATRGEVDHPLRDG